MCHQCISLVKCLVGSFAHIFIGLFVLIEFWEFIVFSEYKSFIKCVLYIYSPNLWLDFNFRSSVWTEVKGRTRGEGELPLQSQTACVPIEPVTLAAQLSNPTPPSPPAHSWREPSVSCLWWSHFKPSSNPAHWESRGSENRDGYDITKFTLRGHDTRFFHMWFFESVLSECNFGSVHRKLFSGKYYLCLPQGTHYV